MLFRSLSGMTLADLFRKEDCDLLISGISGEGKHRYVRNLRAEKSGMVFDALVHKNQLLLMIEFEPCPDPLDAGADIFGSLTAAMADLDGALPLASLCHRVAARIRTITGFDRVMVYRFLKDDSGSVIAEDRREDLVPYFGLRYPASDIPAQARRLYLLNTLRLKADVNARSAALIPAVNPLTGSTPDMTYCVLRSMSPIHVEYLRNMGVAATLSISIVKDGRLWGLIACHHTGARLVPHPTRITCEVLARVFASSIAAAEEQDQRRHAAELRFLTGRVKARLPQDRHVIVTLTGMAENLSTALSAQGCIFSIGGKVVLFGTTPAPAQAEALLTWLRTNQQEHIFASEQMAAFYRDPGYEPDLFSGLLSVRIALDGPDFMLWLRPAVVQVVTWAGNPDKPALETETGMRISPRLSFEQWKQTFRDRAEPWTDSDLEFASALRSDIAEALLLQMNEEIIRLNVELARSNEELGSFAYSASHDLQESVRSIRAFSQLLALSAGSGLSADSQTFITTIEKSAERMGSLITALLSYAQLGGAERREGKAVDLDQVLSWVLTNLDSQVRESGAIVTHDALPVVFGDPDHMMQLLQNLITNAIKFRRPDVPPRIHLTSQRESSSWLLSVHDNGQGFDSEYSDTIFMAFRRLHGREVPGNGIGLAACKRIVDIHHGRIWAESAGNDQGATFWFTMPCITTKQDQSTAKSA